VSIIKTNLLKLFVVITAIYSENHKKHVHKVSGKIQSVSVLNLTGYSNHKARKGYGWIN